MKADAGPGWGGAERERLRAALSEWSVPAVPAEIEDRLRREFRSRRRKRRLAVWLPLAACLGLLAAWPLIKLPPGGKPAGAPSPFPSARPTVASSPRLEPATASAVPSVDRSVSPGRPVARPRMSKPAVIVEPSQAELLVEFARRTGETTEAGPGALMPKMPAAEAPEYRVEWQEVAGEWPAVQVVVSGSER